MADAKMGEKPPFLEYIPHAPFGRGEIDVLFIIKQNLAIDDDAPAFRPHNPGDGVNQRGFARAGTPEQSRHAAAAVERRLQMEPAPAQFNVDLQAHVRSRSAARAAPEFPKQTAPPEKAAPK